MLLLGLSSATADEGAPVPTTVYPVETLASEVEILVDRFDTRAADGTFPLLYSRDRVEAAAEQRILLQPSGSVE